MPVSNCAWIWNYNIVRRSLQDIGAWFCLIHMARKTVAHFSFGFWGNETERPIQGFAQLHMGIQGRSIACGMCI